MFRPFSDILDTDMSVGVVDIRPTRNLALLTQIIGKFEYLHRVDVFNGSYIDRNTELLFNLYLKLLYDGGMVSTLDHVGAFPHAFTIAGEDNELAANVSLKRPEGFTSPSSIFATPVNPVFPGEPIHKHASTL